MMTMILLTINTKKISKETMEEEEKTSRKNVKNHFIFSVLRGKTAKTTKTHTETHSAKRGNLFGPQIKVV